MYFFLIVDYKTSSNHYTLQCNRNLEFYIGNVSQCFSYSIEDDIDCELDDNTTSFDIRLALLTTIDIGLQINESLSIVNVIIDDSAEPECCEFYIHICISESLYVGMARTPASRNTF